MTDFSGRLSNAPVVYALCQVRFSAVLKMSDYLPGIQESVRAQFPRYRQEAMNSFEFVAPAGTLTQRAESRWVLNDADEKSGYLVQQAAFVYHTTAYTKFDEFLRHTMEGVQIAAAAASISLVERVGLRYIDFIVPESGEEPSAYLQPGLAGLSLRPLGFQQETMQQLTSARTDAGRLVLKVSNGVHAQVVPGDLQPLALKTRSPQSDRHTTLLDSDHFTEEGFAFEPKRLESVIRQLHTPISRVFRAAITDYAWNKWK